ncbi:hypothetical protein [Actinocorallia longicatena]|uniref:Uncharacterized protein n=1 Tax=Actinocorallia longicatena TaxID=111803 RepID=A0ABP6QQ56_9ACTN
MGSNSSTAHLVYGVSPTVSAHVAAWSGKFAEEIAYAEMIAKGGLDPEDPLGPPVVDFASPTEQYELFCLSIEQSQSYLQEAGAEHGELTEEYFGAVKTAYQTVDRYLEGLDPEDLQQIAADNGFQHPEHASGTGTGTHPLAYWLNPTVEDQDPTKTAIQAKALERYAQFVTAGGQAEPAEADDGKWTATADQFWAAHTQMNHQLISYADTETMRLQSPTDRGPFHVRREEHHPPCGQARRPDRHRGRKLT